MRGRAREALTTFPQPPRRPLPHPHAHTHTHSHARTHAHTHTHTHTRTHTHTHAHTHKAAPSRYPHRSYSPPACCLRLLLLLLLLLHHPSSSSSGARAVSTSCLACTVPTSMPVTACRRAGPVGCPRRGCCRRAGPVGCMPRRRPDVRPGEWDGCRLDTGRRPGARAPASPVAHRYQLRPADDWAAWVRVRVRVRVDDWAAWVRVRGEGNDRVRVRRMRAVCSAAPVALDDDLSDTVRG